MLYILAKTILLQSHTDVGWCGSRPGPPEHRHAECFPANNGSPDGSIRIICRKPGVPDATVNYTCAASQASTSPSTRARSGSLNTSWYRPSYILMVLSFEPAPSYSTCAP